MKSFREFIEEEIKLPIEVGDIVLGGKFKNKRIVVKDIGENEKGDITKEIEELDVLRQKGLITNDEFSKKKENILRINN